MNRSVVQALVLAVCLLALGCAAGPATAAPSDPTDGDPGELEVQLLDGDGAMVYSYQVDTDAGSINVTDGSGDWENTTLSNPAETVLAIQWALDDAATAGSTVLIGPGTYNGSVSIEATGRIIRGAGPSRTMIAGLSGNTRAIAVNGSDTTVADLAIQDYAPGEGLFVSSGANNLVNLSVSDVDRGILFVSGADNYVDNATVSGYESAGVVIESAATNTTVTGSDVSELDGHYGVHTKADNTTVRDSLLDTNRIGIQAGVNANHSVFRDNEITNSVHIGVSVESSHSNLADNVVDSQRFSGMILGDASADVTVWNNSVSGSRESPGIEVRGLRHRFENNSVTDNTPHGIRVVDAADVLLLDNEFRANEEQGVHVEKSVATTVDANVVADNRRAGVAIKSSSHRTVVTGGEFHNNTHIDVEAKYSEDIAISDNDFSSDVDARYTPGISVRNNTVTEGYIFVESVTAGAAIVDNTVDARDELIVGGITIDQSSDGTVQNNTIYNTTRGIALGTDSKNFTVRDNHLEDNGAGIAVYQAIGLHLIQNNTVTSNDYGILANSGNNEYSNNQVTDNGVGIFLDGSDSNTFHNDTVSSNDGSGVVVNESTDNEIVDLVSNGNVEHGIHVRNASHRTTVARAVVTNNGGTRGIYVENASDVVVEDGTLSSELYFQNASRPIARNNSLEGSQLMISEGSNGATVEQNSLERSAYGIFVRYSSGGSIRSNAVNRSAMGVHLGNGADGFSVLDNTMTNTSTGVSVATETPGGHEIRNNTLRDGQYGIWLKTGDNVVAENDVLSNDAAGIYVTAGTNNTIVDNTADGNDDGIHLDGVEGNSLERNVASSNNQTGIRLTDANETTVTANVVTGSGDDGMVLNRSHDNAIEENAFVTNDRYGLYLLDSNRNVVVENDAARNDQGVVVHRSDSNAFDDNEAHDNEDGLVVAQSSDNDFSGTNARANAKAGFIFQFARNNTLTDVVASDNDAYGFAAHDGSVDNEFVGVTARGNLGAAYTASYAVGGTNRIRGLDVGADAATDVTLDVEAANVSIAAFGGSPGTPDPDLNALGGLVEVTGTTSPIDAELAFRYTDADVSDLDESTIGVWNHSVGNWTERSDAYHDTGVDAVAVRLTNTSLVGLFAEESSSSSGGLPSPSLPGGSGSDDDGPIELSFHDVDASADRVAPDETVTVTVTVRNEDDRSGTRDLALADGATVLDEVQATLAAGEERRITFQGEVEATGTYEFALDGEALATIEVAEAVSDGADDGDDAADDADDEGEADDAAAASGDGRGPWVVVGVLVVAVAGAVAYVRQDQVRAGLAGGRARLAPLGARLGPLWDRAAPLRERSAVLRERLDAFRERRNGGR